MVVVMDGKLNGSKIDRRGECIVNVLPGQSVCIPHRAVVAPCEMPLPVIQLLGIHAIGRIASRGNRNVCELDDAGGDDPSEGDEIAWLGKGNLVPATFANVGSASISKTRSAFDQNRFVLVSKRQNCRRIAVKPLSTI